VLDEKDILNPGVEPATVAGTRTIHCPEVVRIETSPTIIIVNQPPKKELTRKDGITDIRGLCEYLNAAESTVRQYITEGLGEAAGFKVGKEWRFDVEKAIEWLMDRRRSSKSCRERGILSGEEVRRVATEVLRCRT